jgi:hypothetical protein
MQWVDWMQEGHVVSCYEQSNETSGAIKCGHLALRLLVCEEGPCSMALVG